MLFPDVTNVISADGSVASVDDAAEISPDLAEFEGEDTQMGVLQKSVKKFAC